MREQRAEANMPVYAVLDWTGQALQADLIQPVAAGANLSDQSNQEQPAARQDRPVFTLPRSPESASPAPVLSPSGTQPTVTSGLMPTAPPQGTVSAMTGVRVESPDKPHFKNYLVHQAQQVLKQVEQQPLVLNRPSQSSEQRPAEPLARTETHVAVPLSASQVIQAINQNVPIHVANFPAFVNQVIQTQLAQAPVVQTLEVTLNPQHLGKVSAEFQLNAQREVMITLYTQSAATVESLEGYVQEMQTLVSQSHLSLSQVTIKQGIPPCPWKPGWEPSRTSARRRFPFPSVPPQFAAETWGARQSQY